MILDIIKVGDLNEDILYNVAKLILKIEEYHKTLAKDMIETMMAGDGMGLAANQVGILEQIIVVNPNGFSNPMIMINPVILSYSSEKEIYPIEGCLSVPGHFGNVERYKEITIEYMTLREKMMTQVFSGLTARCIQHEIDHLNGMLFTSKIIEVDKKYGSLGNKFRKN